MDMYNWNSKAKGCAVQETAKGWYPPVEPETPRRYHKYLRKENVDNIYPPEDEIIEPDEQEVETDNEDGEKD